MKERSNNPTTAILTVNRGENVVEHLTQYAEHNDIHAAWIQGIGAVDHIVMSYYDLSKKEYIKITIDEECELLSLQGNIALLDNKPVIHAHITVGKSDYSVIGGHLHEMRISGAGEFFLSFIDTKLERKHDEETGLNLLKIH